MKHRLYMLLICGLLVNVSTTYANMPPTNEHEPFEKIFFEYGYKTVDDAVMECEKLFNRNIELPVKLPPVVFTHVFGKCHSDAFFNINNQLKIEYISDNRITSPNHYVIDIRLAEHKRTGIIHKNEVIRTFELEDGTKAVYGTMFHRRINALVFERSGWLYWLWVDRGIEKKVSADALVEIANSIGLGNKYKQKQLGSSFN
jgi:hypothetical protein